MKNVTNRIVINSESPALNMYSSLAYVLLWFFIFVINVVSGDFLMFIILHIFMGIIYCILVGGDIVEIKDHSFYKKTYLFLYVIFGWYFEHIKNVIVNFKNMSKGEDHE